MLQIPDNYKKFLDYIWITDKSILSHPTLFHLTRNEC